jgi:hypothetical protein
VKKEPGTPASFTRVKKEPGSFTRVKEEHGGTPPSSKKARRLADDAAHQLAYQAPDDPKKFPGQATSPRMSRRRTTTTMAMGMKITTSSTAVSA